MTKIEIKILNEKDIQKVIELSLDIFSETSDDPYRDINKWKERIREGLLLGAFVGHKLVGYLLGYKVGKYEFHLWMGGVDRKFRNKGTMSALLNTQEKWAEEHGYKSITANTYKSKFPAMFYLLNKRGFEIYKQKSIISGKRKLVKSYWRKTF